jgi:hypothetical protein
LIHSILDAYDPPSGVPPTNTVAAPHDPQAMVSQFA